MHRTFLFFVALSMGATAHAQLNLDQVDQDAVIEFTGFTGTGFSPTPATVQLSSNTFSLTGFSDGDLTFGGTQEGGDFARGSTTGDVSSGGVYAFDDSGDIALGFQPTSGDFTPGELIVAVQNGTGERLGTIDVSYDMVVFNDQARGNTFDFDGIDSSPDCSAPVGDVLTFTTPEAADSMPAYVRTPQSTQIADLDIAEGEVFYLCFSSDDALGGGSRDEIGIDNITVSGSVVVDVPPQVQAVIPPNGETDIAINTRIIVSFDEPVDVAADALSLDCMAAQTIATEPALPAMGVEEVSIIPAADLPASQSCTLTVLASAVTDIDGDTSNQLDGNGDGTPGDDFSSAFTTGTDSDAPPQVDSTVPVEGAADVPTDGAITINLTEPAAVETDPVVLVCGGDSQSVSIAQMLPDSGVTTLTITPDTNLPPSATCELTILAERVTDPLTSVPLDGDGDGSGGDDFTLSFTVAAPTCTNTGLTAINVIQGSGNDSPLEDQDVRVRAVVVADFENEGLNEIVLQSQAGDQDSDPATSEGIFVELDGLAASVRVADVVEVTGTVRENFSRTVIEATEVAACGEQAPVKLNFVNLPFPAPDMGVDFLERFEGMLVQFPQQLVVTEVFNLDRFGEVLLTIDDRLPNPTQVAEPGMPAEMVGDANDAKTILINDRSGASNPFPIIYPAPQLSAENPLRAGFTTTNLTGVLNFSFGDFKVEPTVQPVFEPADPRPQMPPATGGSLQIAAFNVLNYFSTLDMGMDICGVNMDESCRGADSMEELMRQTSKIVSALAELDADVVGLIEIENNGFSDGSAIDLLVDELNAVVGEGTYEYVIPTLEFVTDMSMMEITQPDPAFAGGDVIAVGLIYKPATVEVVGDPAVLNTDAIIPVSNRAPLAATFREIATDEVVAVAVNHFKSKGSECGDESGELIDPDLNDGQGNCNLTRVAIAEELARWLETNPTGVETDKIAIIGDLNAYAMEDPIDTLEMAGYCDLLNDPDCDGMDERFEYTFVFFGEFGTLDYGLTSGRLSDFVTGVETWHINADEPPILDYNLERNASSRPDQTPEEAALFFNEDPFRSSDHDPVIIGIDFTEDGDVVFSSSFEADENGDVTPAP